MANQYLMDFDALLAVGLPALVAKGQRLRADTRQLRRGDIFVACQGEHQDGRSYIATAIEAGAALILWDTAEGFQWSPDWQVSNVGVPDLRQYAGAIAAWAYGNVGQQMTIVGITGTNGKTSCTHWYTQAMDALGQAAAVIGTLGNGQLSSLRATQHTTPDALTVQNILHDLAHEGVKYVAMEVSSHGLVQHRVQGVLFRVAVLTNLSRDHLDYHGSMEAYAAAKRELFVMDSLQAVVLNGDDAFGLALQHELQHKPIEIITYGFSSGLSIVCESVHLSAEGMVLQLTTPWGKAELTSGFLGLFNAENLMATLAAVVLSGVPLQDAVRALATIQAAPGRMQRVGLPWSGLPTEASIVAYPTVIVDYAHTPDALQQVLVTLRDLLPVDGKLLAVFGCGGDRDTGKRPLMGEVVSKHADESWLTSDNPRSEDPKSIIRAVRAGMNDGACVVHEVLAREQAIAEAIAAARVNDIVLIAGKGHESYQEIHGVRYSFDDVLVAQSALGDWVKNK